MPTCTGCTININGAVLPGTGAGSSVPFLTRNIVGNGFGAFSGITNFNLGTIEYYYGINRNGSCTGYTGLFQALSTNQSGTGLFNYLSDRYVCTGVVTCALEIYQKFIPHPVLSGIAPNFYAHIQTYNSEGAFDIGRVTAGATYTTPTLPYVNHCGFQDYIFNVVRFGLAPYSGYIGVDVVTNIDCLPCISGA
jgi:hypothetical protein